MTANENRVGRRVYVRNRFCFSSPDSISNDIPRTRSRVRIRVHTGRFRKKTRVYVNHEDSLDSRRRPLRTHRSYPLPPFPVDGRDGRRRRLVVVSGRVLNTSPSLTSTTGRRYQHARRERRTFSRHALTAHDFAFFQGARQVVVGMFDRVVECFPRVQRAATFGRREIVPPLRDVFDQLVVALHRNPGVRIIAPGV